jgi:thiol-disulfide isomerase/thioredoxin
MKQTQSGETRSPAKNARLVWAGLGLIVILAALYGAYAILFKPSGADLKRLARGDMAKLAVVEKPAPQPIAAQGPDGRAVNLSDFKGDVVLVNLWATWCAPCVKEMPTLARLQARYAGRGVKVLAISLDKGPEDIAKAKTFIADKAPLQFYHGDYALAFSITPPAEGLPTTLVFDRSGREQARLSGGADWSGDDAAAVIDRLLAQKS